MNLRLFDTPSSFGFQKMNRDRIRRQIEVFSKWDICLTSVTKVCIPRLVSREVWGHASPGKIVKLDALRSLLKPICPQIPYVLHFIANQISTVATHPIFEVMIADCV